MLRRKLWNFGGCLGCLCGLATHCVVTAKDLEHGSKRCFVTVKMRAFQAVASYAVAVVVKINTEEIAYFARILVSYDRLTLFRIKPGKLRQKFCNLCEDFSLPEV